MISVEQFLDERLSDGYRDGVLRIEFTNDIERQKFCDCLDLRGFSYEIKKELRSQISNRIIIDKSLITDFVYCNFIDVYGCTEKNTKPILPKPKTELEKLQDDVRLLTAELNTLKAAR